MAYILSVLYNMFDNFNRKKEVGQTISEVVPEAKEKDDEYGLCIYCRFKADIQVFKENINKKNEQEKQMIYEFFKSDKSGLLLCEFCFPHGECATCGDEVSLEQCIEFRKKIDPRGEHGEFLTNTGSEYLHWFNYNNIYLCKECDEKYGRYYCYYCTQPLTKKEIHHFYLWDPCPLDGEIYENKDTKGNPCCSKCYTKQDIRNKWFKVTDHSPPIWNERLTLDDLNNHKDEIPQKRIQEENVNYGLARCANEKKGKSIEKLRAYLLEKEGTISCHFCEKEVASKKSLKEFQEKLVDADKTDIKEYDGVWRLGDMSFDTGDEYIAVNKNFFVCEKCIIEITCSQCNKLLTRQQIFNLINSEGEWNSLNEGLCVGGPVACTECWIKRDSQMQWDMGIRVCDSCNNFDDECECSSDEEEEDN